MAMMRKFTLVAPACFALFLIHVVFAGSTDQRPPNILLILLDDAGYADFGYMGSKDLDTPRIDQLAASGVAFTDFHVSATVCSPSRAGLITGRYQQRFGYECNIPPRGLGLDPEETTLAEALKSAGYRTIVIGKWHLGNDPTFHPNNHGFDEFYGFLEGGRSYFPSEQLDQPLNPRAILRNRSQVDFEGYLTDVFTDEAIAYIRESADRPFFLYLSYNAVHTPMDAKEEHLQKYAGHNRAKLAAMTWSVDENIGRVMDELKSLGIVENTLVFFLSDNGGSEANDSSNLPLKGWKGNKYEGGHRVPAIISWPGHVPAGEWFHGLASSLDIYATAVAAVGLPLGNDKDGMDLIPYISGKHQPYPHRTLYWRKDKMAAVRDGALKLVRLDGFGYRMYDLESDLGEMHDLSGSRPEQFASIVSTLGIWESGLVPPLWYEGEDWSEVTWEIHYDLMNNQPIRFVNPSQMQRARARDK